MRAGDRERGYANVESPLNEQVRPGDNDSVWVVKGSRGAEEAALSKKCMRTSDGAIDVHGTSMSGRSSCSSQVIKFNA